jgi:hypothetical protein
MQGRIQEARGDLKIAPITRGDVLHEVNACAVSTMTSICSSKSLKF